MEILWFKVLTILIIFAAALFAGSAPTRMRVSEKGERQLIWGNAFSGGIFLGAGLLHMLPDARVNFAVYAGDVDFPVPALLCGAGFLLVLLLEKAALGGSHDVGEMSEGRPASPFLLCLILSTHSIIAGTSLGLEATLVSATAIFIAIIAHKGAASFALGVSLRESKFPSYRHMVIICFFSAMTPLGVILGTSFSAAFSSTTSAGIEALFDSLAAGTFLYVAVVDIIENVFRQPPDRWIKVSLISSGFVFMALIAVWA